MLKNCQKKFARKTILIMSLFIAITGGLRASDSFDMSQLQLKMEQRNKGRAKLPKPKRFRFTDIEIKKSNFNSWFKETYSLEYWIWQKSLRGNAQVSEMQVKIASGVRNQAKAAYYRYEEEQAQAKAQAKAKQNGKASAIVEVYPLDPNFEKGAVGISRYPNISYRKQSRNESCWDCLICCCLGSWSR